MSLEFLSIELALAVISIIVAVVANFLYVKSKLDVLSADVRDITEAVHREAVNHAATAAIVDRIASKRKN